MPNVLSTSLRSGNLFLCLSLSFTLSSLILPSLICLFSVNSHAADLQQQKTLLTLQEALNIALSANPEIAVAMREGEVMTGIKMQAAARINPAISTTMQDTRSDTRQITVQLSQEIELGNKRQARINAADAYFDKSNAALAQKKADIHANVVAAFYGLLIAQERLNLALSSLTITNLALEAASKRVKAGKSSPVEETKSNIARVSAQIEANQANSLLNSSRKRLSALLGGNLALTTSASGLVDVIPALDDLSTLTALLEQAPAVELAKIEIAARSALTSVERSKTTPNITIHAGVVNNQELGLNQALLGLTVPIPLFDRNQGNVQAAISQEHKAQDELLALKNQLSADLNSHVEQLNNAKLALVALKKESLPNAQSVFDAANKGFAFGKFGFLDVLDAQRTLFQVKSQYVTALAEAHTAIAEIERILGDVVVHPLEQNLE